MIAFRGGHQLPSGQRTGLGSGFAGVITYLMEGRKADLAVTTTLPSNEKRVAWTGTRNLPVQQPEHAAVFMRAWANQNARVVRPVYHFGVSLAPGERLERDQWEVVADRMLQGLGLTEHQVFFALHQDRPHQHLHLAVNRVGPDGRVWKPSFDALAQQKVARELEREFALRMVPTKRDVEIEQKRLDHEGRIASMADRVSSATENDFRDGSSWTDLDGRLAAKGLRLTAARRGGGVNVTDGTLAVPISRLSRDLSGPRLAKRYGQTLREHRAGTPPPTPTTTFGRLAVTPELPVAQRAEDIRSKLEQSHATWTEFHLKQLCKGHADGKALAERVLSSDQVVLVHRGSKDKGDVPRYSTVAYLRTEDSLFKSAAQLQARSDLKLPAGHVRRVLNGRHNFLSPEQRDAVTHATLGTDCPVIVGRAGSGKTSLTAAIVEAYSEAGYQVQGAALAGVAAQGLASETGIQTQTLAAYEKMWQSGKGTLTPHHVLVVDEAGMTDTYQLERVLSHAQAHGAKVILVGDPEQLPPVGAGDPLRRLVNGCARVDKIRRQRGWQRDASEAFTSIGPRAALDAYDAHDKLHWAKDPEQNLEALLMTYFEHRYHAPQESSIVLAPRNAQVLELNERIRTVRRRQGELENEIRVNGTDFASGDRVLFLSNDNHGRHVKTLSGGDGVGVKNGTTGTLLVNDPDRFSVHLDSGRVVEFDPRSYNSLTHGYAVTVHKAQGVTVDRTYVLLDTGLNRNTSYVAFTRHREALSLYADRETFASHAALTKTLERKAAVDLAMDYDPPSLEDLPQQRGPRPQSLPAIRTQYLELTDARLDEVLRKIEALHTWDHSTADLKRAALQRTNLPHQGSLPDLELALAEHRFNAPANRFAEEQSFAAIYRDPQEAFSRFDRVRQKDPELAYRQLAETSELYGNLRGHRIGQARKDALSQALRTAQSGQSRWETIQRHTTDIEVARGLAKEIAELTTVRDQLGESRLALLDALRRQVETLDRHTLVLRVPEHMRQVITDLKTAEATHLEPLKERRIISNPSATESLQRHRVTSPPLRESSPHTPTQPAAVTERPAVAPQLPLELRAKHVLSHLERHDATWTRSDLQRLAQLDPEPPVLIDTVLAHPDVVTVGSDNSGNAQFSTRGYMASESHLWAVANELAERRELRLPSHLVPPSLPPDYQAAFHHATTGSDLAIVLGTEGEERTVLLRAISHAYSDAGYTVRGAALGGQAAAALSQDLGVDARALTSYELAWKRGRGELTPRDIFLVDEAGMVDTNQMRRVLEHATSRGAKVVLLDQHTQLKPIGAGDALRGLLARTGAARVAPIHNQREAWQQKASADLAAGRFDNALQSYSDHGSIHWTVDREQSRNALVMQYFEDRTERPDLSSLVLARRNVDVLAINDRIRQLRVGRGELPAGVTVRGREYAAGDRLLFLRNDNLGRHVQTLDGGGQGVRNGDLGTVIATSETAFRVHLDVGRTIEFDPKTYTSLAHGYAGNLYKSRHTRVDRAYILADASFNKASTYVALTRHRESLQLYADQQSFASGEALFEILAREPRKSLASDYNPAATRGAVPDDTLPTYVPRPSLPLTPDNLAESQAALEALHRWDRLTADLKRVSIARERLPHAGSLALLELDLRQLTDAEPGSTRLANAEDALATAKHYQAEYDSSLEARGGVGTHREDLVERVVRATSGLDAADLELGLPSNLHRTLADVQRAKRIHLDPLRPQAVSTQPASSEALADYNATSNFPVPQRASTAAFATRVRDAALSDFHAAVTWDELEDRLAARGLRLDLAQRGGGVNITDTQHTVALSRVDRTLSGPRLADRLGEPFRHHRRAHPEPPELKLRFDQPDVTPELPLEHRAKNLLVHLEEHRATWTRYDLERLAQTDANAPELVETVLRHESVLSVGEDVRQREHFSTRGYLQSESRLWTAAHNLAGRSDLQVPPHKPKLLAPPSLAAYQHATAGPDLAIVVSSEGANKVNLTQAIVSAHQDAGYEVRGAALGGHASETLAQHAAIESKTLAAHETAWRKDQGRLTNQQVLMIDQAGVVDTHQMRRVLEHAESAGAKVILFDTEDHLKPIGAGDPFRGLEARHGAAHVSPAPQQTESWQRDATRALADGRTEKALRAYSEHAAIQWAPSQAAAREALVARHFEDYLEHPDQTSLVIARRNSDVLKLNHHIRSLRAGELRDGVSVRGKDYAPGDRIFFLRNDTRGSFVRTIEGEGRGVTNGTLGTVTEVSAQRFRVRLDTGRTVEFDPSQYNNLTYGYAATLPKARTSSVVDRAYVLADAGFDKTATAFALSRHRRSLTLYADAKTFETGQKLAETLTREPRKTLAVDLDPPAVEISTTPVPDETWLPPKVQPNEPLTPERLAQVTTKIDALQRWDRYHEEVQRLVQLRASLPYQASLPDIDRAIETHQSNAPAVEQSESTAFAEIYKDPGAARQAFSTDRDHAPKEAYAQLRDAPQSYGSLRGGPFASKAKETAREVGDSGLVRLADFEQLGHDQSAVQLHARSEAQALDSMHNIAPSRAPLLESLREDVRALEPNELHNALPQHQRQTLSDLRAADRLHHVQPILEALQKYQTIQKAPSHLRDAKKIYSAARKLTALRSATPKSVLKSVLVRLAPPQLQAFIAASAIVATVARKVGKVAAPHKQHERGVLNI